MFLNKIFSFNHKFNWLILSSGVYSFVRQAHLRGLINHCTLFKTLFPMVNNELPFPLIKRLVVNGPLTRKRKTVSLGIFIE